MLLAHCHVPCDMSCKLPTVTVLSKPPGTRTVLCSFCCGTLVPQKYPRLYPAGDPANCKTEIEQIDRVFSVLGTPTDETWPGFSEMKMCKKVKFKYHPGSKLRSMFPKFAFTGGQATLSNTGFDLLEGMLSYDPGRRLTARQAAEHPWFDEIPRPQELFLMPTMVSGGGSQARTKSG